MGKRVEWIKNKFFKSKYCEDCRKIQQKNFRRVAIAYAIIFLAFGIFIYLLETSPSFMYGVELTVNNAMDNHNTRMFNSMSEEYSEDVYVQSIATICSLNNKSSDRVKCVHDIATRNFYYLEDEHQFFPPKDILTDGGVCRDWAVLFSAIYSSMGYEVEPIFLVNHVFIIISDGNKSWKVDQQGLWEFTPSQ